MAQSQQLVAAVHEFSLRCGEDDQQQVAVPRTAAYLEWVVVTPRLLRDRRVKRLVAVPDRTDAAKARCQALLPGNASTSKVLLRLVLECESSGEHVTSAAVLVAADDAQPQCLTLPILVGTAMQHAEVEVSLADASALDDDTLQQLQAAPDAGLPPSAKRSWLQAFRRAFTGSGGKGRPRSSIGSASASGSAAGPDSIESKGTRSLEQLPVLEPVSDLVSSSMLSSTSTAEPAGKHARTASGAGLLSRLFSRRSARSVVVPTSSRSPTASAPPPAPQRTGSAGLQPHDDQEQQQQQERDERQREVQTLGSAWGSPRERTSNSQRLSSRRPDSLLVAPVDLEAPTSGSSSSDHTCMLQASPRTTASDAAVLGAPSDRYSPSKRAPTDQFDVDLGMDVDSCGSSSDGCREVVALPAPLLLPPSPSPSPVPMDGGRTLSGSTTTTCGSTAPAHKTHSQQRDCTHQQWPCAHVLGGPHIEVLPGALPQHMLCEGVRAKSQPGSPSARSMAGSVASRQGSGCVSTVGVADTERAAAAAPGAYAKSPQPCQVPGDSHVRPSPLQVASGSCTTAPTTKSKHEPHPPVPKPPQAHPPHIQQQQQQQQDHNAAQRLEALLQEVHSVMDVVVHCQDQWEDVTKAQYLSQCQYLIDALGGDEHWLVHESLLQLKAELGIFDQGEALAARGPGWHRLRLSHAGRGDAEHVTVWYGSLDQRKAGGEHACCAIALLAALWCLQQEARQQRQQAYGGLRGRTIEAVPPLQQPAGTHGLPTAHTHVAWVGQRHVGFDVDIDDAAFTHLIVHGSALWRRLRDERIAAGSTACDDFEVERMMAAQELSQHLRQADYSAVLLAPLPPSPCPSRSGGPPPHAKAKAHAGRVSGAGRWSLSGALPGMSTMAAELLRMSPSGARPASGHATKPPPSPACASSLPAVPTSLHSFPDFMAKLEPGVYVLGCHGHFSTLWVSCCGAVRLLDSLGFTLAPNCPHGFVAEWQDMSGFVAFFCRRHQEACNAALGTSDMQAFTDAALLEVHRMEVAAARC